jgi:hypothetical protein
MEYHGLAWFVNVHASKSLANGNNDEINLDARTMPVAAGTATGQSSCRTGTDLGRVSSWPRRKSNAFTLCSRTGATSSGRRRMGRAGY